MEAEYSVNGQSYPQPLLYSANEAAYSPMLPHNPFLPPPKHLTLYQAMQRRHQAELRDMARSSTHHPTDATLHGHSAKTLAKVFHTGASAPGVGKDALFADVSVLALLRRVREESVLPAPGLKKKGKATEPAGAAAAAGQGGGPTPMELLRTLLKEHLPPIAVETKAHKPAAHYFEPLKVPRPSLPLRALDPSSYLDKLPLEQPQAAAAGSGGPEQAKADGAATAGPIAPPAEKPKRTRRRNTAAKGDGTDAPKKPRRRTKKVKALEGGEPAAVGGAAATAAAAEGAADAGKLKKEKRRVRKRKAPEAGTGLPSAAASTAGATGGSNALPRPPSTATAPAAPATRSITPPTLAALPGALTSPQRKPSSKSSRSEAESSTTPRREESLYAGAATNLAEHPLTPHRQRYGPDEREARQPPPPPPPMDESMMWMYEMAQRGEYPATARELWQLASSAHGKLLLLLRPCPTLVSLSFSSFLFRSFCRL